MKAEIEQRNAEAAERAAKAKAERDAERARLDDTARKQREREEEAERRAKERSSGAYRRVEPTASPGPTASPPVIGIKGGGWRDREAKKTAEQTGTQPSPASATVMPAAVRVASPASRPPTNDTAEPEAAVPERGSTWKRGMGARGRGGVNTPPSTRGASSGSKW